jgi:hypothetical protein
MNTEQRRNTKILIQVLEDMIEENLGERVLDSWLQPCGSHGCVAGNTALKLGVLGVFRTEEGGSKEQDAVEVFANDFYNHFGFLSGVNEVDAVDADEYLQGLLQLDVFGVSGQGTLQERLDYVTTQLEYATKPTNQESL